MGCGSRGGVRKALVVGLARDLVAAPRRRDPRALRRPPGTAADPGRALRHGRFVARSRGHLRGGRRPARRTRLLRPGLRPHRPGDRPRQDGCGRVEQVRRHGRDRQPATRLREGVHRRRDRPARADRGRDRPVLAPRPGRDRCRLPGVPRRPRRGRSLLGADRVRARAERTRRRRHRAGSSTRRLRSARLSSPTTPTTPGCGSVPCWVSPTWPASTSWCWPTTARRTPASGTGPSS